MEYLSRIAPDLLAQFLLGAVLLYIFSPASSQKGSYSPPKCLLACILTSLLMLGMSLTIEFYAAPYLRQASIVAQWFFFILIGQRICQLSLGKSIVAQICFFSCMLGAGMLQGSGSGSDLDEEERQILDRKTTGHSPDAAPDPEWVTDLESSMLPHRLLEIREDVLLALYGAPASPPPSSPPTAPSQTSVLKTPLPPEPEPLETVQINSEPEPLSEGSPATVEPVEETPDDPAENSGLDFLPSEPVPEPEVLVGDSMMLSRDTEEITEVRNRSTDRMYPPPPYEITAVSGGSKGRFAMVDGRLLREGAVLRTGSQEPRGWKLYRITDTEVFWQPLQ